MTCATPRSGCPVYQWKGIFMTCTTPRLGCPVYQWKGIVETCAPPRSGYIVNPCMGICMMKATPQLCCTLPMKSTSFGAGGCTGSSESIYVKIPHCWKSHVAAHLLYYGLVSLSLCAMGWSCYVI